ncbi:MAG: hypothetical protein ABIH66_09400, partial [bacterium]
FTKDFEENLKRNEYWQNILDGADIVGRPLNFFHKLHEDSLKVTSEQVVEAAKKHISDTTRVEIIAMPGEKKEK